MKCEDIMIRNVESLTERDSIGQAARLMAGAGVGFLSICDAGKRVVGVITDRDVVVRAVAKQMALEGTPAAQIMSTPVVTCLDTSDLREAEQLMREERKSRLVIVDAEGRPRGVLSLADIIEFASASEALETARALVWREALGPRGGAAPGESLLKDDPAISRLPPPDPSAHVNDKTVFLGGHHGGGMKEFPG